MGNWTIEPTDKLKYEKLFEFLKPVNGLIPGDKVRGVLMDSKLPLDVLSKIWDLADQDKDGSLDKHEFIVVSAQPIQIISIRKLISFFFFFCFLICHLSFCLSTRLGYAFS